MRSKSPKSTHKDKLYEQAKKEYCAALRAKQIEAGLNPPEQGLGVWCEAGLDHGERRVADHIHHKKYRAGNFRHDQSFFMAVSWPWHPLRIHQGEQHNGVRSYGPKWAREKGYILD